MKKRPLLLFLAFFPLLGAAQETKAPWSVPQAGHSLVFPRDHGSHPDFRIEWWYLTGHLFDEGRRFGFQATFFRLGSKPVASDGEGDFANEQYYLAHMALSGPASGAFLHEERLNRAGWDAGAKVGDLDLHNGNWRLRREGGSMVLSGSIRADASLSLRLLPEKAPVVFGQDGISRKGPEGTASSYYITFPRLRAEGSLRLEGRDHPVTGEAWMDHEISSSQLDRGQVGWDWISVQFDDGRELMAFVLRTEEGGVSPFSSLTWVAADGALTESKAADFEWRHEGRWKSPKTGATYPISPLVVATDPATGERRAFRLEPLMETQEIVGGLGGISYWEGACDVRDEGTGKIVGRAYLEMTGYAGGVAERLR